MMTQPILLTPEDVRTLISCPLHYHFLQQKAALPPALAAQQELARLVGEAIQELHAAGGPARMSLDATLWSVVLHPAARQMVENYYRRLERDWPRVLAVHETMTLKISIAGISLLLEATVDRLDRTSDGGILAILLRTEEGPLPGPDDLRQDPALTIYHALVAAAYPLRRPVRIQELWLQSDQEVTIELDEEEYRSNLQRLREPVRALARGEVMARPGLHCDVCPFKYRGCPVYTQAAIPDLPAPSDGAIPPVGTQAGSATDTQTETEPTDFDSSDSPSKISPRQWIFKN